MGQKINPVGLRLQVNRTWESRWFANTKEYGDLLHEDLEIRKFIKKNCAQSGISCKAWCHHRKKRSRHRNFKK